MEWKKNITQQIRTLKLSFWKIVSKKLTTLNFMQAIASLPVAQFDLISSTVLSSCVPFQKLGFAGLHTATWISATITTNLIKFCFAIFYEKLTSTIELFNCCTSEWDLSIDDRKSIALVFIWRWLSQIWYSIINVIWISLL